MLRKILPIGKNIKKLKKQKGLSQDRLSKLADISYNTVIKLGLGGITNPSIDTLQKLAEASIEELSSIKGIGLAKAAQIKAAFEISRRLSTQPRPTKAKNLPTRKKFIG